MNSYASLCDDFGLSVYVQSKLEMPTNRETILHFFEAVQKASPRLTEFEKRDSGEYMLEEDRESGSYRWVSLDAKRLSLGYVNPPTLEEADEHSLRMLEMAPYHFDLSALQTESMDVLYYFDFIFQGNHDEVVADALASGTPLEGISQIPGGRVLNFQPSLMMALDESCQLQCRMSVETRSTAYHVRTGNFIEAPISVYFTVRQFWGKQPFKNFTDSYHNQRRLQDELVGQYLIPNVIAPLQKAISAKQ